MAKVMIQPDREIVAIVAGEWSQTTSGAMVNGAGARLLMYDGCELVDLRDLPAAVESEIQARIGQNVKAVDDGKAAGSLGYLDDGRVTDTKPEGVDVRAVDR
uniref:Uncharacterized protein n=1 Tax=viral metagenome TaxID=1070528 RepID=A0A6M3L1X8_9ZZZZ